MGIIDSDEMKEFDEGYLVRKPEAGPEIEKMKGIIPQGKPCTRRLRRLSAASCGV
jgi:hypothetical protein